MNNFILESYTDLYRADTILAFAVSYLLHKFLDNTNSVYFSIRFVIIFLLLKNILNI
jgi:hypothetical protein